ncbi:MAG TPA: ParB/RepB/Spo0J family partition protein [bacterium]|nr:ParB/RepB/Spo0J family partition protein [bacterium]
MKAKRLGRGLEALIPDEPDGMVSSPGSMAEVDVLNIRSNPFQPRKEFDADGLNELKQSILANGVIQPITVRPVDGGYELIAGERRLRAVRELGYAVIPAYVVDVRSEDQMLEMALVENIQREDLNPIELAKAYKQLLTEYSLTHEEVAQKVGKDRATVTNFVRLLKLPQKIQNSLSQGEITMGHAKCFMSIVSPDAQLRLWKKALSQGWSVRKLEALVREEEPNNIKTDSGSVPVSPHIRELEDRIRAVAATQVHIRRGARGGKIEIYYYSDEDLDRLVDLFENMK